MKLYRMSSNNRYFLFEDQNTKGLFKVCELMKEVLDEDGEEKMVPLDKD